LCIYCAFIILRLRAKKGDNAMPKSPNPFVIAKRTNAKTFQFTLNYTCGLTRRVCDEWRRRSFHDLPADLIQYRNPKTRADAKAGVLALITYLKNKQDEGSARRETVEEITVGAWLKKFTAMDTSPRTGINAARNRPYSAGTIASYKGYYETHIKSDFIANLSMREIQEEDALEFATRLSLKKMKNGQALAGTRTYAGVLGFIRMAFREYQRRCVRWANPLQSMDRPVYNKKNRDALEEDEMLSLFRPGVLQGAMDKAVCAAMFLSGLRRAELIALKPEDLDWVTPKITVRRAWQNIGSKDKILGPTKGKRERRVFFDPVLQEAIENLWKEYGKHEYVFSWIDGIPVSRIWIYKHFKQWLKRAGIKTEGRDIVPHSARHSLASLLEARGVSLHNIQDLLGHSDLKTTKIYLHTTEKTIRDIGTKITEAREKAQQEQKEEQKVLNFKIS
jgi:integrase/recombinase XerD